MQCAWMAPLSFLVHVHLHAHVCPSGGGGERGGGCYRTNHADNVQGPAVAVVWKIMAVMKGEEVVVGRLED